MKKLTKRVLSVFLALAMIVTILPPMTAQAATIPKKLTLYVGESCDLWISCESLKGVASTNKAVVVAKAKKADKMCTITPKKAGTATVTIKEKEYFSKKVTASKIKVTVKKPSFTCKVQPVDGGYVLLSVKNNTKQTFETALWNYSIKDTTGEVIKSKTDDNIYKLIAGKTYFEKVYVGENYDVDYENSTVKVTKLGRYYVTNTYKALPQGAVEYTELNTEQTDSQINFDLKLKNTLNKEVEVRYYVIAYDANNNIIDVPCSGTRTLGKKEVKTANSNFVSISSYSHPNYDHYKIVLQGYYIVK